MQPVRIPARPVVRLRPAPPLDPPFEDESDPQTWALPSGARQLALKLGPVARTDTVRRRRAEPAATVPPADDVPRALPSDALAAASPEARQAARRFLTTCLEIFNGYRPVSHIRPLSGPFHAQAISQHLATGIDRMAGHRVIGRPKELVRLRTLRVCEPRRGVAEAAAALSAAGRTWAIAFRLEQRGGSWVGRMAELL
ncbi:Rv3235 family protein [Micromonospora sp. NPDC049679]|uniref:Rv3235 family protein n=1 Tax=Micromonospora sp. NPDC049679 TaxID=3155920 RepID=UPI0033E5B03E